MTSSEDAARFFDAIAACYDRTYALDAKASRRRISRLLPMLPPRARILDLGVGTGRELPALLDAGHQPTGLDVSPRMLELCGRRARPIPLVLADFWKPLPFPDRAFDAAIALHGTLAHPPDDEALSSFPNELARVLVPGGVFVAEVPSPDWLSRVTEGRAEPSLRRTGTDRCVHVDAPSGVSIEGRVLAAERWRTLFAGWSSVEVMSFEEGELLVIARR